VETPVRQRSPVDVFRYSDYRRFLADFYQGQKRHGLSYRSFARRAGLGAPNYLKLVIDGQRNLMPEMAERFGRACGLQNAALEYFCELVRFCQASGTTEKAHYHQRLLSFRRYRDAHRLEAAQSEYHSSWYLPAIRELVTCADFEEDPKWIAKKLSPALTMTEAKQAVATLLRLGLLVRDENARLRQSCPLVTTGPETKGVHVASYHAEMMKRAVASMDLIPATERDISSITVAVGPEGLTRLKQRVQAFRKELLELAEAEGACSQVVQLNFQLFPLTRTTPLPAKKSARRTGERTR
jgi:uncharacterized protein (TIGR02147 family)